MEIIENVAVRCYQKWGARFPRLQRTYRRYRRYGRVGNPLPAYRSDCLFVPVLGMHRSGTSATSNLLESNGLFFGNDLIESNRHNPEGFFESDEAIRINEAVLRRFGVSYMSPSCDINRFPSSLHHRATKFLMQISRNHSYVGWKDPRTTVTWPCWQEILSDSRTQIVGVFRHPARVVSSLMTIYGKLSQSDAQQMWLVYNRRLLSYGDAIEWVNFDLPLVPQIQRVISRIGLDYREETVDRYDESLVHNREELKPTGRTEVDATYELLRAVWLKQHGEIEVPAA